MIMGPFEDLAMGFQCFHRVCNHLDRELRREGGPFAEACEMWHESQECLPESTSTSAQKWSSVSCSPDLGARHDSAAQTQAAPRSSRLADHKDIGLGTGSSGAQPGVHLGRDEA